MQNECQGRVTFGVALPPDYSRFLLLQELQSNITESAGSFADCVAV